jgi:hypothetical protein
MLKEFFSRTFNHLSSRIKNGSLRKADTKSVSEKKHGTNKKGDVKMEEAKKDVVETETETETKKEETKPVDEQTDSPEDKSADDSQKAEDGADSEQKDESSETAQVTETDETSANGLRIEDIVTKTELADRLAALEAKLESVIKENQDLKDKYEKQDFGTESGKGVITKDNQAEDTFAAYAKNFM